MKPLFAFSLVALAVAGCASQEYTQEAKAECKAYPVTTLSVTGNKQPTDSIHQRAAEADLATSSYRFRNLARTGPVGNPIEDVIRDCNR